jgi:hypothetical protein
MNQRDMKQAFEELYRMHHGKVLVEYLEEKIAELNDVSSCTSWEETQGRAHAVRLIRDLFWRMQEHTPAIKSKTVYH